MSKIYYHIRSCCGTKTIDLKVKPTGGLLAFSGRIVFALLHSPTNFSTSVRSASLHFTHVESNQQRRRVDALSDVYCSFQAHRPIYDNFYLTLLSNQCCQLWRRQLFQETRAEEIFRQSKRQTCWAWALHSYGLCFGPLYRVLKVKSLCLSMVDKGPLLTSAIIFYLSIGAAIFQVLEEPNWKLAAKQYSAQKDKILEDYPCLTKDDLDKILEVWSWKCTLTSFAFKIDKYICIFPIGDLCKQCFQCMHLWLLNNVMSNSEWICPVFEIHWRSSSCKNKRTWKIIKL